MCSVPKCRPDCYDEDVECTVVRLHFFICILVLKNEQNEDTAVEEVSGSTVLGLRQTAECYGNGECRVVGNEPTCFCDASHDYSKLSTMTETQSLCKDLIPSISYIEHYDGNFSIFAANSNLVLEVDDWSVFTITIDASIQVLHVNLTAPTLSLGDPMLLVRTVLLLPRKDEFHPFHID